MTEKIHISIKWTAVGLQCDLMRPTYLTIKHRHESEDCGGGGGGGGWGVGVGGWGVGVGGGGGGVGGWGGGGGGGGGVGGRRDIFCLKNFGTFSRTPVRVSKMNAVARAQLIFQMLTLLKKYL